MKVMKNISKLLIGLSCMLNWACEQDYDLITAWQDEYNMQIVGRVTAFNDYNVSTRALKNKAESEIKSMSLFIFDDFGKCVDFQYVEGSSPQFVIDRRDLNKVGDDKQVGNASVYILANVPMVKAGTDITKIQEEKSYWLERDSTALVGRSMLVEGIDIPMNSFPMIGSIRGVNLEMDGERKNLLEIPLENLYAKIVFNIKINTTQSLNTHIASFQMSGWEVHDVPNYVSFGHKRPTADSTYIDEVFLRRNYTGNNPVSGSNIMSFSFYMPEHLLQSDRTINYPDNIEEHEKQRYKPLRVKDSTAATFVRIKGSFTDHQGHDHSLTYDIYLGEDNWQNFEIKRNAQYNNNITIKGITNYSDATEGTISVDHRVNVEERDFIVSMERETMLDCHFEVRPLRVKLNNGGKVVAKVESGCDWIRLEKKNAAPAGDATYCSDGKRKYFTTDLVKKTLANSTKCEVTSNDDNCIWAYIDENTDISKASDGFRLGKITFEYYAHTADSNPTITETYTLAQRYLYPIKVTREDGSTYTYYIECYEEYLHDFDSNNDFNQTDYEGMEWGLEGLQISSEIRSMYQDSYAGSGWLGDIISDIINNALGNVKVFYDFYLTRDKTQTSTQVTVYDYNGYDFTRKIITAANDSGEDKNKIGTLTLNETPKSAVEYCYNKNKRNATTGLVDELRWYLPAIDEMEEIVKAAYTQFEVFQENYYWSSQPAYKQNQLIYNGLIFKNQQGKYYIDNVNAARATKVSYSNGVYSVVPSGMSGFYQILTYNNKWGGDEYSVDDSSGPRIFDDGYNDRTKKNRIRAVYMPPN